MIETKEKIAFLESLRIKGSLSVVIFHFKIGSVLNNGFTDRGFLMVNFSFCLDRYCA